MLGAVDVEGFELGADEVVGTGVGDENTTSNSRSLTSPSLTSTFWALRRRLELEASRVS